MYKMSVKKDKIKNVSFYFVFFPKQQKKCLYNSSKIYDLSRLKYNYNLRLL